MSGVPAPNRFVRELTTFIRGNDGSWRVLFDRISDTSLWIASRSRVELVDDRQLDLRRPGVALARDGRRRSSPAAVEEGLGRVVPRQVLALFRQHQGS